MAELFSIIAIIIAFVALSKANAVQNKMEGRTSLVDRPMPPVEPPVVLHPVAPAITPDSTVSPAPQPAQNQPATPASPTAASAPQVMAERSAAEGAKLTEESLGRHVGKIGIVALVLGAAYFVKLAYGYFDPTTKFVLSLLFGMALLGVGQWLRKKYQGYSDLLLGGGIAILYLSIYAGYAIFDPAVLGTGSAYALMILVTILAVAISVVDSSLLLALLGTVGGFATPLLLSTGNNDLVGLSLYMLVLDLGVVVVSFWRSWPALRYVCFVFTWLLLSMSAFNLDFHEKDGPVLLFSTLFFLVFLAMALVRHFGQRVRGEAVDHALLGLNTFIYLGWALDAIPSAWHGFLAAALALLYIVVAIIADRARPDDRALGLTTAGLAVVMLTIAIPLQFSGHWIALAWLVESVVLVWLSFNLNRELLRVFGVLVGILGFVAMLGTFGDVDPSSSDYILVFNRAVLTALAAVGATYAIAWLYHRFGSALAASYTVIVTACVLANILTVGTATWEIGNAFARSGAGGSSASTAVSIFWGLYAILLIVVGFARSLKPARLMGLALIALTACRIFLLLWELGTVYRVISLMAFGLLALLASFGYAKYKDKL